LDLDHDIAILRVDNLDLPSLRLADESSLRVGERIVSLGVNPNEDYPRSKVGEVLGLNRSITATNIFGDRVETLTNLMTMSVIIEPGSSGGPVLNEQGLVVGVNVATAADRETSFAVDADALRSVINFFEATGGFDRPFLGLLYRVILIDDGENQSYSHGSEIIEILSGSSVAQSDLQVDDVIVAINGEPLENGDLMRGMRSYKIGNTISLTFLRDGALMSIQLELAGR
jgi:S1-C subfamily serine protease